MRFKLLLAFWFGFMNLGAQAQTPATDSLPAAQQHGPMRAMVWRIAVPSALVGVGVLALDPRYCRPLYQAKLALQAETRQAFAGFDAHGIDDYSRHAPLV